MSDKLVVPAEVRQIKRVELPRLYSNAKNALAECFRVDECREWSDKAKAIASYARQAQDDELERLAIRIRGRASRRGGELIIELKENGGLNQGAIPGKTGAKGRPVLDPRPTLRDLGVSKRFSSEAQRIAAIPEAEFEAAVEREDPLTPRELASMSVEERGRALITRKKPEGFAEAVRATGAMRRMFESCAELEPVLVSRGLTRRDQADELVELATSIEQWLTDLVAAVEKNGEQLP